MEYREFRAGSVDEGDDGKLVLRAAPFNSETIIGDLNRGGWKEEIAPGCFTKALREGDTLLLADHEMAKPIARMSAGTLRLAEGKTHLEGDADPADTSYYRDLRVNIKARNKGGMSIGFVPVKDEWFDDQGRPSNRMVGTRRVLREVKLPEVSIVTNPAYKDTAVFARDDSAALLEERAAKATYADLETCGECNTPGQYGKFCSNCGAAMSQEKPGGKFCTSCGGKIDKNSRFEHLCLEDAEARAAAVKEADRKALAGKGHALPDGSYPIPDIAHLHAAAILAASHHGDWKAAQELIRKRAPELGVDVNSLPGFNETEQKSADDLLDSAALLVTAYNALPAAERAQVLAALEGRDDPDGKEYDAIDEALKQLQAGDVKGAEKTLAANQAQRAQEPEASTPEDDDPDFALRVAEFEANERSRNLGYVEL